VENVTGRVLVVASSVVAAVVGGIPRAGAQALANSSLNGVWTLNRAASEFPEIGFNLDVPLPTDDGQSAPAGGRGRRGTSGGRGSASPFTARRESYEDGQRKQLITGEARNPPVRLMFVDTGAAVTITNELGQSRTMHPNGKTEPVEIQGVVFMVTSQRDGDRLVATYQIESDRQVRYTYSTTSTPRHLSVQLELVEHGTAGDKATRVYDFGTESSTVAGNRATPPQPAASAGSPASPNDAARENFDARPGAELKGLKSIGIVVEDLGPEAQACGLKREAIETALAARLTAGGLSVRRNSDEETYFYVNIITTAMSNGTCVSRYDAFLYSNATAKLAYRDRPVAVQVSLMHRGGIGTSAVPSHAATVARGLEGYVDVFVSQIRDANK
jgi:hypothetical protein